MRPAWPAITMVVVAIAAAGCAGEGGGTSTGSEGWAEIARTLAPQLGPTSENVCNRGDADCLVAVVDEMSRRLQQLADACDHGAAFAFMYREVTVETAHAGGGFFSSAASLNHLDAIFASLYFDAVDAWRADHMAGVPRAWQIAFEAARDRRVIGIGDMLLGMNAHISRDLPFALAAVLAAGKSLEKSDFDRVNELLERVQRPMLTEAARRFDPTIDDFSLPVLDVDDSTVGHLLAVWREEAWLNAERLLSASTPARRSAAEDEIENQAALRALAIRAATSYVPFVTSTRIRDDWCAAHRRAGTQRG